MIGRRLVVLAVGVVACALPVAASAEPATQTASPKRWAAAMCTSLKEWQQSVQANGSALERTLDGLKRSGDINMRAVRGEFVTFLDGLARSTDGVRVGLGRVGAPSIPHGAEIQRQLEGGFGKLAGHLRTIASRARRLPLDDPRAFKRQTEAIGVDIKTAMNVLGPTFSALDKYDSTALDAAAEAVPACKILG